MRMSADEELSAILNRRNEINEGGGDVKPRFVKTSVYTEFSEFSRKQIKDYEQIFKTLVYIVATGILTNHVQVQCLWQW